MTRTWTITVFDRDNKVVATLTADSLQWANQLAMWASKSNGGYMATIKSM